MGVIDLTDDLRAEMAMSKDIGNSIGDVVNGIRKKVVQKKLIGIMANEDMTPKERLTAITNTQGGLWSSTTEEVNQFFQRPDVMQKFINTDVGNSMYPDQVAKNRELQMKQDSAKRSDAYLDIAKQNADSKKQQISLQQEQQHNALSPQKKWELEQNTDNYNRTLKSLDESMKNLSSLRAVKENTDEWKQAEKEQLNRISALKDESEKYRNSINNLWKGESNSQTVPQKDYDPVLRIRSQIMSHLGNVSHNEQERINTLLSGQYGKDPEVLKQLLDILSSEK